MLDAAPGPYASLQEKYGFIPFNHEKPNFFPVNKAPVFDAKGLPVPGYQRIERGDTGDTIAIHTDSYSLVPYERHFALFEEAIAKSDLKDCEMLIATDQDKNGARIYRQYMWPTVRHVIPARSNREIALRIVMWDSYDGSSSFIGKSGFFDFACANMAMIGLMLADVKFRHVGDMDKKVQLAAEQLTKAAEDFTVQARRMAAWTQVKLIAAEVEQLVTAMPQANKPLIDHVVASWAKEGDNSLWGVHQALTAWSTHGVPTRTQLDRGKRISTLIEGKDWKILEPA